MDEFLDKYIFPYTEKYIGRSRTTKEGLPLYTKQEELVNTGTHIAGIFMGIGVIAASILYHHSEAGLIGGIIFGCSMVILYLASSVYHGTSAENVKEKMLFRLFDHCSIFILIGGSCTPFILSMVYKNAEIFEWVFYGGIWALAIGGITLLCVNMKKFKSIATILYVIMGVLLVIRGDELAKITGETGLALLLAGGGAYLIGFLFYGLGTKRAWMHTVFHGLCLVGSILHCICICGYVI